MLELVLYFIFIADINEYLPAGVKFEKYADDIIAYIIAYIIGELSKTKTSLNALPK